MMIGMGIIDYIAKCRSLLLEAGLNCSEVARNVRIDTNGGLFAQAQFLRQVLQDLKSIQVGYDCITQFQHPKPNRMRIRMIT